MTQEEQWAELAKRSDHKHNKMDESAKKLKKLDLNYYFDRPVFGKIIILPHKSAIHFKPDKPWACISIFHGGEGPIIHADNRVDLLQMDFADAHQACDHSFKNEQAVQIKEFAERTWPKVELLMVHCWAGISRSAAVATALSEVYQPEFARYFRDLYAPNPLVYLKLRSILRGEDRKDVVIEV